MDWNLFFVPSEEAIACSLLRALLVFRRLELHVVGTPLYEISVANL
jgi:hypothetical protein